MVNEPVVVMVGPPASANVNPFRAFTAKTSAALIVPEVFTSRAKLMAFVVSPVFAFTALMSLAVTERELSISPIRKPIDTGGTAAPLTPARLTVTRCLSGTFVSVVLTSLPEIVGAAAVPTGVTVANPAEVTGLSN